MQIAVVILNWNGKQLLEKFLPSVIKFSAEATIYVIDNHSEDDSVTYLNDNYSNIKVIKNLKNYGFAKGYNVGLKAIKEEIYVLLNSDVEVTENWLRPIINIFDNEPHTAIVQPKILDYKRKDFFEYAGAAGGFIDKFGYPFCRGRIFETIEKDNGQYNDEQQIFWASGACFFIRKKVFDDLKGFDQDFFAHQEEIDLCWRAFNHNLSVKYCSRSIVYHVGGATLEKSNPKKTFLNFRNSLFMLTKNIPKSQLFFVLFCRMILDGLAGIQFLIQGKFSHFVAILKAHFSFYALFKKIYAKRNKQQRKHYFQTKSIVFKYFIKNGKVFDSLF